MLYGAPSQKSKKVDRKLKLRSAWGSEEERDTYLTIRPGLIISIAFRFGYNPRPIDIDADRQGLIRSSPYE